MFSNPGGKIFFSNGSITTKAVRLKIDDTPALNAIHQLAQSVVFGDFGVNSDYWFDSATQKINLLHEVENKIANDLKQRGRALKADAQKALGWLMFLMVAIISLVLFMAKFMVEAMP